MSTMIGLSELLQIFDIRLWMWKQLSYEQQQRQQKMQPSEVE